MNDLRWGLWMTVVGMGTVFLLLLILMAILLLIGKVDRPASAAVSDLEILELTSPELPAAAPAVSILASGLTADQVAAVTVAVLTHARVRRTQAAPAMRVHQPGSHLYASRWLSAGRTHQNSIWRRS
ncbi:MAG: hypothetical protein ACRDAX_00315 [Propionibacteriaceae bacterium]